MQRYIVDSTFYKAKSAMMNMNALLKLPPKTDLNRFAQAVNDTLNNYDIFHCRLVFHPETNDICQRFDGEIIELPPNQWSFAENSLNIEVNLNEDGKYYIYFDYDSGAHSKEVM